MIPAKVKAHFGDRVKGLKLALWGLSFKPHTDDMREAPSLKIVEDLIGSGVTVKAYDPVAIDEARRILGDKVDLRVDANGAWSAEEAESRIAAMMPFGISGVEQPVAKVVQLLQSLTLQTFWIILEEAEVISSE